jgi:hypothetical protein
MLCQRAEADLVPSHLALESAEKFVGSLEATARVFCAMQRQQKSAWPFDPGTRRLFDLL